MKEIIFLIEEDPDGGFNAQALGQSIFTEADSTEELKKNIVDAVKCHFEKEADRPQIIHLHFVRDEILNYA
jgi:hypothetical protein